MQGSSETPSSMFRWKGTPAAFIRSSSFVGHPKAVRKLNKSPAHKMDERLNIQE